MAITSGYFNSVNGDRKYNADQMSEYFEGIINEGVCQHIDGGLAVTAGTGLSVNVAAGKAFIGKKWIRNDASLTLTISAASASYARIDAVVLRRNNTTRTCQIVVKSGTPAASPAAPTMTRNSTTYEMALAYVNVAANATSVTVTDKRADTTVCGWATVAQSTSGEVDQMLNDMKTGFDWVEYSSPAAMVQGEDQKIVNNLSNNRFYYIYELCVSSSTQMTGVTLPDPCLKNILVTGTIENRNTTGDGYFYFDFCASADDPGSTILISKGGLITAGSSATYDLTIPTGTRYIRVRNVNMRNCTFNLYGSLSEGFSNSDSRSNINDKARNATDSILQNQVVGTVNLFDFDNMEVGTYWVFPQIKNTYGEHTDQYITMPCVKLAPGRYSCYGISATYCYLEDVKTGQVNTLNGIFRSDGYFTITSEKYLYPTLRIENITGIADYYEYMTTHGYVLANADNPMVYLFGNNVKDKAVYNEDIQLDWWKAMDVLKNTYQKTIIADSYTRTITTSGNYRAFQITMTDWVKNHKTANIIFRFSCSVEVPWIYEEYNDGTSHDITFQPIKYKHENGLYYYAIIFKPEYLFNNNMVKFSDISVYTLILQQNFGASSENPVTFNLIDCCYVDTTHPANETSQVKSTDRIALIKNPNWDSMTHISVKKDGTGDFTDIQSAINSVYNASIENQYVVDVYDDFECTDLTELYSTSNYTSHPASGTDITEEVAMVVGKDWVHVRGMNGRRKLSIVSPSALTGTSFQNIVVIRPFGNQIYENLDVTIKGGRYAIHHEAAASRNYHKAVLFRNMYVAHYGNSMYPNGSSWGSVYAQANGTSSGVDWFYDKVTWYSKEFAPYYTHQNQGFDAPCHLTFKDCSMIDGRDATKFNGYSNGCYFGDIGSTQLSDATVIGCNFPFFTSFSFANTRGLETSIIQPDDIRMGGMRLFGHSNMKAFINPTSASVMGFTNTGSGNVEVVGGSAYDDLWGETWYNIAESSNAASTTYGIRKIYNINTGWGASATNVYSLAARLGNCASSNKTLKIKVGSAEYTITFDSNYMTSDGSAYTVYTVPYMDNDAIKAEINSKLQAAECSARCVLGTETMYDYYSDQKAPAMNYSDTITLKAGAFVVRDRSVGINGWKIADASTTKDDTIGIVARTINPGESGEVILTNNLYMLKGGTIGTKWKFNASGELQQTSGNDGIFINSMASIIEQM